MLEKPRQKLVTIFGITTVAFGLSIFTELKSALADRIGYLGPVGTFSQQATKVYQSTVPDFDKAIPYDTITGVVTATKSGEVTRGLIPVENSDSGFVAETYRLISVQLDPGFRVIDEVTIPITYSLLVKPGTQAHHIKKIISHPNALRGVSSYLSQNFPNIPQQKENSTATAAKKVSLSDGTTAAIASPNAAPTYGLQTLAQNIQNKNSKTKFWAIVRSGVAYKNPDSNHLIVALEAPKDSQIFSETIALIKDAGFNITNVQSIPVGKSINSNTEPFSKRYRYLIKFKSNSNSNVLKRVSTLLKKVQELGGGQALLIGAYKRPLNIK